MLYEACLVLQSPLTLTFQKVLAAMPDSLVSAFAEYTKSIELQYLSLYINASWSCFVT
jgi:hypothetical protein